MVLMSGAGKTTVVFLSTPISTRRLQVPELQCQRMGHHRVRGIAKGGGGDRFALGGDDLGPLLPLGLRLAGHGPLHAVRQLDVLELHERHRHAPFEGQGVQDLPDVGVICSVSDSVWSRLCRPTTFRRVVWAIWLMAAATFSIATTDFTASTTR